MRPHFLSLAAWTWLLLLCIPLVSSAQTEAPSLYERELAAAIAAYQARDWEQARLHFQAAHDQQPSARTLRGLGVSAFEAKHFALAARDLQAASVHPVRPLDPPLASSVRALIEQARLQLGIFVLSITPDAAEIRVDDAPAVRSLTGELLLEPGPHQLEIQAAGHSSLTLDLSVHAGQRETLRLALSPLQVMPSAPSIGESQPAPRDEKTNFVVAPHVDKAREVTKPLGPYVKGAIFAATVAGLALIGAGSVYAVGQQRVEFVSEACRNMATGQCTPDEAERRLGPQDIERLERTSHALIAVAAVGALLSGTLWVVHWRRGRAGVAQAQAPFALRF